MDLAEERVVWQPHVFVKSVKFDKGTLDGTLVLASARPTANYLGQSPVGGGLPTLSNLASPSPGTGTVLINGSRHGHYRASWQSRIGEPEAIDHGIDEVTRDEAIAWARGKQAVSILIADFGGDYKRLD